MRCTGYLSHDGRFAHCSRGEHAGPIAHNTTSDTYAHRMHGACKCGVNHGERPAAPARVPAAPATTTSPPSNALCCSPRSIFTPLPGETRRDFVYEDAAGEPLYVVVRFDGPNGKRITQGRPDGRGGLVPGLEDVPRVPYHANRVRSAPPELPVVIVEGEAKVEAVEALGLPAMCAPGGAGKWRPTYGEVLRGRLALVAADNDPVGDDHAKQVEEAVRPFVRAVRRLVLPGLPPGGDVVDWVNAGGDAITFSRLVDEALAEDYRAQLVLASEVTPTQQEFLWWPRIPLGKTVGLVGDGGLGKSMLTVLLAACVSTGRDFPDGTPNRMGPRGVVFMCAEDSVRDIIVPRLIAMGADLSRIVFFTGVRRGNEIDTPCVPRDLLALAEGIARVKAGLLVIDPAMSYIETKLDAHKDQHVRRALAPVVAMGERLGCSVILVRHLNKSNAPTMEQRESGSAAFRNLVRSSMLLARDPSDADLRVLVHSKANGTTLAPTLSMQIEAVEVEARGADGEAVKLQSSRLLVLGESSVTLDDLVTEGGEGREERTAQVEAADFLRDVLAAGPMPATQVSRLGHAAMLTSNAIITARRKIGVIVKKVGFDEGSKWLWSLPDSLASSASTATSSAGARPRAWIGTPASATATDDDGGAR